MISTTDFKEGLIFENENGEIVEIVDYQHHRKSQARAVVRVKLRKLGSGSYVETSYRPEDKFKEVSVEKRPFMYLYSEGDMAHFMNNESYDQVAVPLDKLENQRKYLIENMECTGLYINDQLFDIVLPIKVVLTIKSTVPGVKGDTVSNLTKEAELETGVTIKVPLFINEGDKVIMDTRYCTYVERA
ncbi:Translation elongation factor [Elusimicrobium minutum Pei191]|uniref:Elongation factor P n=1 Tax=Elusimicrobium minutum (strain Pei191) TaxID=445932 RepID=EFP_ELUMP|nr:elongation factor P [Elusimicrobium minutum]B2KCP2.1 RecName: Full=Elongation factor P; Short=EF-P [Elusimicrobium minutum Pei191]ACC98288.1 Translation elongation factor [Elusimicrobium minutum Pei191]